MKPASFLWLSLLGFFVACSGEKRTDVSTLPQFRGIVGLEYEIIGPVEAYGIRKHSNAPVDYVTLLPPPGVAGSYVGFRVPLSPGSVVVVQRIYETNRWTNLDMSYDVNLKGTALPASTPIRIDLFQGNEGKDRTKLNPTHYRRVSPDGR